MALLTKQDLLKREILEVKKVDLGKGDFVYVRQMMAYERDKFEQSLRRETKDAKGNTNFELSLENFRAKLAVCTICDEKGDLILTSEDYPVLSRSMSAARMEKIIEIAQTLNAITEKDKEELVKNSDAGQAGSSSSASAEN
jgi:uncharacterized Fe-S radical SAM superfamily protein PflX